MFKEISNYKPLMSLKHKNKKSVGTDIMNMDSCRGCINKCKLCWKQYDAARAKINFDNPVLVETLTEEVNPNHFYRFGNAGDPAYNWEHTERIIQSKKNLADKSFYCTKLQNIAGFTGIIKRLQVSADPLDTNQLKITLDNVDALLNEFKDIQIVLRVRSLATTDLILLATQKEIVKFANERKLTILETRLRFKSRDVFEKYSLIPEFYLDKYSRSYFRPKPNLPFLKDVDQHYLCDAAGEGCVECLNCLKLFNLIPEIQPQEAA